MSILEDWIFLASASSKDGVTQTVFASQLKQVKNKLDHKITVFKTGHQAIEGSDPRRWEVN